MFYNQIECIDFYLDILFQSDAFYFFFLSANQSLVSFWSMIQNEPKGTQNLQTNLAVVNNVLDWTIETQY